MGAAACSCRRAFDLGITLISEANLEKVRGLNGIARARGQSLARLDSDDTGFHEAKLATARFFFQRVLPRSSGHFSAIMAGKAPVMEMKETAF